MLAALTIIAVTSTYVYKKGDNNKNVAIEIARAFSMKENLDELTRSHPGELNILDGIRFLIIFIELFVHQGFLTFTLAPYNKLLQLEEDAQNPSRWFLFGTLLGVDVFFLISGLLTFKSVIATVDKIEWQSLVKMIIKRYFRLAPLLALTLFACIVMLDHFGSGPMWYATGARTLDECKKSWWISLLLINNYFGDEVCYAPSWSIPCDFQMFFVAVILLYLYSKKRHIGIKAFAFVFALSLIMPAVTTYKHDLPAQMPLLMPMNGLIRDKYFTSIYIKTHNRIGPYLIGMALGYGMSVFDPKTYKKSISKTFSIVLVFTGFSIMVAIGMTSGWSMYRGFPRIIEILFAASYRTAFGAAFGLCFFPFVYGTVPILNDFLCWKVFRPLSRLSYGVYIFHFLLILLRFSNSRDPVDGAIPTTFLDGLGTLVFSVLLAFIAWLLVEAPVNHLCNHWLKSWVSCPLPLKRPL